MAPGGACLYCPAIRCPGGITNPSTLVEVMSVGQQKSMYQQDARDMAIATFGALVVAWGPEDCDLTLEERTFHKALEHFHSKYSGAFWGALSGATSRDVNLEAIIKAISLAVDTAVAVSKKEKSDKIIRTAVASVRQAHLAYPASSPSYAEIKIVPPVIFEALKTLPYGGLLLRIGRLRHGIT